jgi:DNA-binding LytR/AlgR family response regulator
LSEISGMGNKLNRLLTLLKGDLGLFLSISFGLFLFILFFQPFPLDNLDFDNRLVFVAGLGSIVFLFMVLVRISFASLFRIEDNTTNKLELSPFLGGFVLLALSSVAFAFYLRYVGNVYISFYLMLRVLLICMVAPVVLRVYDRINILNKQNDSLVNDKKVLQKQVEKFEEDYLNKSVEFISENSNEKLVLQIAEVAFIRSADNYVEIVYCEKGTFRKKLIRNTMKNIEQQIKLYTNFIRCHRICIINTHFIEKLNAQYGSHWISIKGHAERIPVSRQYLLKLREAI